MWHSRLLGNQCRNPTQLVDLYITSIRSHGRRVETNFVNETPSFPNFEVVDYLVEEITSA